MNEGNWGVCHCLLQAIQRRKNKGLGHPWNHFKYTSVTLAFWGFLLLLFFDKYSVKWTISTSEIFLTALQDLWKTLNKIEKLRKQVTQLAYVQTNGKWIKAPARRVCFWIWVGVLVLRRGETPAEVLKERSNKTKQTGHEHHCLAYSEIINVRKIFNITML